MVPKDFLYTGVFKSDCLFYFIFNSITWWKIDLRPVSLIKGSLIQNYPEQKVEWLEVLLAEIVENRKDDILFFFSQLSFYVPLSTGLLGPLPGRALGDERQEPPLEPVPPGRYAVPIGEQSISTNQSDLTVSGTNQKSICKSCLNDVCLFR